MRWLAVISIVLFLFWAPYTVQAQSPHDRLAEYYAEELHSFSGKMEEHITQLNKCMEEMDSFEEGSIFIEPKECPKFDKMRNRIRALLKDVRPVIKSFVKTLNSLDEQNYWSGAYDDALQEMKEANALLRLYETKFQQAMIQSKRVQKQEKEIANSLNELNYKLQMLKRLKEMQLRDE